MSISKVSKDILVLCSNLKSLRNNQAAADNLSKIANELREVLNGFEPMAKSATELANELSQTDPQALPGAPPNVSNLLDTALEIANTTPLELPGNTSFNLSAIRTIFNSVREPLSVRAHANWNTIKTQNHSAWPDELLEGLKSVGFSEQVNVVRNCARDVANAARELPKDNQGIKAFLDCAAKHKTATECIDLPEDMKAFIQRAGGCGVPLDSLTDSVRKWLKDKGLMDKFAVKFASQRT